VYCNRDPKYPSPLPPKHRPSQGRGSSGLSCSHSVWHNLLSCRVGHRVPLSYFWTWVQVVVGSGDLLDLLGGDHMYVQPTGASLMIHEGTEMNWAIDIDWCMHWTVHSLNIDSREFWFLLCSWSWVHAKDHNPDGLTLAGGHCSVCISGDWATFVKFDAMVSLCPVFPKDGSTICWSSSCHFVRSSFGEEMEWLNLRFTQTKTDLVFVATSYFACSAYKFLLLCQSLRTWYSDSMIET